MNTLTPAQFVKKWSKIQLKERTTAQSHFNDICALVGHKTPLELDPKGEFFTFEASAEKPEGEHGWADAFYRNKFIWEYKGPNKSLEKAYQQLLLYKDSLGNPHLLITSDTHTIRIHTNFNNTVKKIHTITLDDILAGSGVELLRLAFNDPESFKPAETPEQVTKASAKQFVKVANLLQKEKQKLDPERLAHFIVRLLFCLFAEDLGLLPDKVFTNLVKQNLPSESFRQSLKNLFTIMRTGGMFGFTRIPHFNGGLFDDDFVPDELPDIAPSLRDASVQDWSSIDPSIFGTIFEEILDEDKRKRAQLGVHYTGKEDILLVIEPVLMQPLREKWQILKLQVEGAAHAGESKKAYELLQDFSNEVASIRVLDPACGSGNFLYVALRQLLDLQKEIITLAARLKLPEIPLTVGPQQIYGIEINSYAHELAQITIWIGYLQWRAENGFAEMDEPILKPLHQIENKDAIIDIETGKEPEWPAVDVIIGNPPFLGGKLIRIELSDKYVDKLFVTYQDYVPHEADLVCYWFEKSRSMIEKKKVKRVGLLATQGIRGGANRKVLEKIKETGNIFWAQSDRNWILDGATVHVSMIGFDDGSQKSYELNEIVVSHINSDLTSSTDLTLAKTLNENQDIAFMGITPLGDFDIPEKKAREWIKSNKSNNAVVRPFALSKDITGRPSNKWVVDFGLDMKEKDASAFKEPFEYLLEKVRSFRATARAGDRTGVAWWRHQRPRPEMRKALSGLSRYIVTPGTSKHRLFVWLDQEILADHGLFVFARDDNYFFGILHSKINELWTRRKGTQVREAESGFRYTPTTTFETFPFPWSPSQEPKDDPRVAAIAEAAKQLDDFRNAWLNPKEEQFRDSEKALKKRTLTNLYNALTLYREDYKGKMRTPTTFKQAIGHIIGLDEIETLVHIHTKLNHAVLDAYGWPYNLSDEQILEKLLALNLERAKAE